MANTEVNTHIPVSATIVPAACAACEELKTFAARRDLTAWSLCDRVVQRRAALKLGARPGTIRQWFHRGIPYRWQIRLMEYFEGPVEIRDWAPAATAAIAKPSIAETWRKKHPVSS
ncbi:MAG: hypothetical protein CR217_17715 [Beijerinckiaceae bacterium]|nr:MAG: hypothetical protein CR217_17715 [Beijerinckiaceae bacterium]